MNFQAYAQTGEWSNNYCVMYGDVATIQGIQCLLANVLSAALPAIGFATFLIIIVGAYRYLLSGGNSKGTETARNSITFAVVGIVVALSAFIILNLIKEFTGVESLLEFTIPKPTEVQDTGI